MPHPNRKHRNARAALLSSIATAHSKTARMRHYTFRRRECGLGSVALAEAREAVEAACRRTELFEHRFRSMEDGRATWPARLETSRPHRSVDP